MSSLNGNGLVATYGWWAVNLPLSEFGNDFKLTKKMHNNTFTAGWYFSANKVSANWWWHNMLVDISGHNTRKLNLVNDATGESLTTNGYTQYGTLFRDYNALTRINALYLMDQWNIGLLTINAGLRWDMGKTYGYTENVKNYSYDVNGDGIISPAETNIQYGDGTFIPFNYNYSVLSWSIGLNYELNENTALFARASNGHRAPADRAYAFGATTSTVNGFPSSARVESIDQYELGLKYNSSKLALFATAFYSNFSHIAFTDFVNVGGSLQAIQQYYNTSAVGLELEAAAQLGNLNLSLTGTYQDAKYHNWVYHDATGKLFDFNNHFIQRLPQLYFTFRPTYQLGKLNLSVAWQYFGKRYTNPENKQTLPQFSQINANVSYNVNKHITLAVAGNNLFNAIGLTEGNPRSGLTSVNSQYFYARSILGRSAVMSFRYNF
jgi:outer membrane receptor protein involved in Fe transport